MFHVEHLGCAECGTTHPHEPCEACGQIVHVGEWPFCPHGKPYGTAIDDQLAGGPQWIENLGDQPVYVETKSQLAREARARGRVPFVRHAPGPSGDRSKHTTRWV